MRCNATMRLFILVCLLVCLSCASAASATKKYAQCRIKVLDLLTQNGSITLDPNGTIASPDFPDPIYHGSLRGFNSKAAPRPVTLTQQGCLDVCGSGPEWKDVVDAFSILTTWVLPIIGLLTSLPYDSLSEKKRKNLEAFSNWIGAPAAALTTTVWNISMIQKCRILTTATDEPEMQPLLRDSLYILSCINQYQYPRNTLNPLAYERRDTALLRGVLAPFVKDQVQFPLALREKIDNLTLHLAFQLRLYRRKGVYPLWFSLIWFLLAFIFSIVIAFAQLGDNTTAHSLALGLLLSWMPVLVLATIIDRNPVASTRCGVLIERWLFNIDALFTEHSIIASSLSPNTAGNSAVRAASSSSSRDRSIASSDDGRDDFGYEEGADVALLRTTSRTLQPSAQFTPHILMRRSNQSLTPRCQWHKGVSTTAFNIGEYVGQGRRLRYCAVTDTVLEFVKNPRTRHLRLPNESDAKRFRTRLTSRPFAWYITWVTSQTIVGAAYGTAFVVSFMTPTIGLGCRSLCYTIWYLLSFVSWLFLGIFQEPPQIVRYFAWIPNALATTFLFAIMLLQVIGGLNTCACKSSSFGSSAYGGYMDFENAQFYHQAYNVEVVWATATACGIASCTFALAWFWRRWSKDSSLWRVTESANHRLVDGLNLDWLT